MNKLPSVVLGAVTGTALMLSSPAQAGGEAGPLTLRDVGSRFVGYTTTPAANGSVDVTNAMFVQYMLPAERRHRYPIVMIHGGGGQGTDWLQTPDGRDGWADYFVAAGWDVYVVDRPGHGRSQSNPSCGDGRVRVANSGFIARLATADAELWEGGAPTPTNPAVVGWTASGTTAPYCGDGVAAEKISALLDEIGPAILLAHSAGGGSTFRVPDLNPENVIGILAFEAVGSNPVANGFDGSPGLITTWKTEPALPANFASTSVNGCPLQGEAPARLVNYSNVPITLIASAYGLGNMPNVPGAITDPREILSCQARAWQQAGVDATSVYLPDRGLRGGGHFAMAQKDTAEYARVFIELAVEIERKSGR